MDPQAHLGMALLTRDKTYLKEKLHIIITHSIETPQGSVTNHLTSSVPTPNEIASNARNNY
jgi:hypothetical protein